MRPPGTLASKTMCDVLLERAMNRKKLAGGHKACEEVALGRVEHNI